MTDITKVTQGLEELRDTLLSGTIAIQVNLLKIEQTVKYMSEALNFCQELIKECTHDNMV